MYKDRKQRKIDNECRVFNKEWEIKYFFVEKKLGDGKALCLICYETIAVMKEYNLRRHYETKHMTSHSKLKDNQRVEKFERLASSLYGQQNMLKHGNLENECLTLVSMKIAYLLSKSGKPFFDGNVVKDCMMEAVSELCPEKMKLFQKISLSRNTITRRTEDIGKNISFQLNEKVRDFVFYSLAIDESTDINDTSQILIFIRGVDAELNITQELASVCSMYGTSSGKYIFNELLSTLKKYNLKFNNMQSVTIDGGKNMSGQNIGLVGHIRKACEIEGITPPIFIHCIIHQQALCLKHLDMSCVLKPVTAIVNFIRSKSLKHRQFRSFLEELESDYNDLTYYAAVRWLSCGKMLLRFFKLRKEINLFIANTKLSEPLLNSSEWLWKLAFFADMTSHINHLNLKLQGKNNIICDLRTQIKAFRSKLSLLSSRIEKLDFNNFSCCEEYKEETFEPFPLSFALNIIENLQQQFERRFRDLELHSDEIGLFQNPFVYNASDVHSSMQMELIDLQANNKYKYLYKESGLVEFYKYLDTCEFPNLKKLGCKFVAMFGTTYTCEQAFSRMKYIKSKYRANLSDEHLQALLMISVSELNPDFQSICQEKKQFHHSH